MKRGMITSLAVVLAWWGAGANLASAQFGTLGQPPARPRPTVSPYVNLGGGSSGAINYYGLIRPQTDTNRSIMDLQNVVTRMNPDGSLQGQLDQTNPVNAMGGLQTGHSSTFFNYGRYYPLTPTSGYGTNLGGMTGIGTGNGVGGLNPNLGGGSGFGLGNNRTFFGTNMNQFPR